MLNNEYRESRMKQPDILFGRTGQELPCLRVSPLQSDVIAAYTGPDGGLTTVNRGERKHVDSHDPDVLFIDSEDEAANNVPATAPVGRFSHLRLIVGCVGYGGTIGRYVNLIDSRPGEDSCHGSDLLGDKPLAITASASSCRVARRWWWRRVQRWWLINRLRGSFIPAFLPDLIFSFTPWRNGRLGQLCWRRRSFRWLPRIILLVWPPFPAGWAAPIYHLDHLAGRHTRLFCRFHESPSRRSADRSFPAFSGG